MCWYLSVIWICIVIIQFSYYALRLLPLKFYTTMVFSFYDEKLYFLSGSDAD